MATHKVKKADNKTTINVNLLTDSVEEGKLIARLLGMSFTAYLQECLAVGNLYHIDRFGSPLKRGHKKDD